MVFLTIIIQLNESYSIQLKYRFHESYLTHKYAILSDEWQTKLKWAAVKLLENRSINWAIRKNLYRKATNDNYDGSRTAILKSILGEHRIALKPAIKFTSK